MNALLLASSLSLAGSQSFGTPISQLLPCSSQPTRCIEACGVTEFKALQQWLELGPSRPENLLKDPIEPTLLELSAFQLFRELGSSLLGVVLDYTVACQYGDSRCNLAAQHFQQFQALREALDQRLIAIAKDYSPDTGVRSPVLRVGRNLRSDLDRFLNDLPGLEIGLKIIERSAGLLQGVGQRSRMLSQHLGMHAWVRSLAVPGRGAPVLNLHGEQTWEEMLVSLIGTMVRNGPRELAMAEIGIPLGSDWVTPSLLLEYTGIQYVGIAFETDGPSHRPADRFGLFEQLKAQMAQSGLGDRAAMHFASSEQAVAALPPRSLDLVFLDVRGSQKQEEELRQWEIRVKPGGVLAGRGFEPNFPDTVKAVCDQRLGTDLHLSGGGGGFWWLVEPEE